MGKVFDGEHRNKTDSKYIGGPNVADQRAYQLPLPDFLARRAIKAAVKQQQRHAEHHKNNKVPALDQARLGKYGLQTLFAININVRHDNQYHGKPNDITQRTDYCGNTAKLQASFHFGSVRWQ